MRKKEFTGSGIRIEFGKFGGFVKSRHNQQERCLLIHQSFEIRDFRDKSHFWVDDILVDQYATRLGPTAVLVYLCLCRHANSGQIAWPSHKKIGETLGLSKGTIKRAVGVLRSFNIIAITLKKSSFGDWDHNSYTLLDKKQWSSYPQGGGVTHGPTGWGHQRTGGGVTSEPLRINKAEGSISKFKKDETSPPPQEWSELLSRLKSTSQQPV